MAARQEAIPSTAPTTTGVAMLAPIRSEKLNALNPASFGRSRRRFAATISLDARKGKRPAVVS